MKKFEYIFLNLKKLSHHFFLFYFSFKNQEFSKACENKFWYDFEMWLSFIDHETFIIA